CQEGRGRSLLAAYAGHLTGSPARRRRPGGREERLSRRSAGVTTGPPAPIYLRRNSIPFTSSPALADLRFALVVFFRARFFAFFALGASFMDERARRGRALLHEESRLVRHAARICPVMTRVFLPECHAL